MVHLVLDDDGAQVVLNDALTGKDEHLVPRQLFKFSGDHFFDFDDEMLTRLVQQSKANRVWIALLVKPAEDFDFFSYHFHTLHNLL